MAPRLHPTTGGGAAAAAAAASGGTFVEERWTDEKKRDCLGFDTPDAIYNAVLGLLRTMRTEPTHVASDSLSFWKKHVLIARGGELTPIDKEEDYDEVTHFIIDQAMRASIKRPLKEQREFKQKLHLLLVAMGLSDDATSDFCSHVQIRVLDEAGGRVEDKLLPLSICDRSKFFQMFFEYTTHNLGEAAESLMRVDFTLPAPFSLEQFDDYLYISVQGQTIKRSFEEYLSLLNLCDYFDDPLTKDKILQILIVTVPTLPYFPTTLMRVMLTQAPLHNPVVKYSFVSSIVNRLIQDYLTPEKGRDYFFTAWNELKDLQPIIKEEKVYVNLSVLPCSNRQLALLKILFPMAVFYRLLEPTIDASKIYLPRI